MSSAETTGGTSSSRIEPVAVASLSERVAFSGSLNVRLNVSRSTSSTVSSMTGTLTTRRTSPAAKRTSPTAVL